MTPRAAVSAALVLHLLPAALQWLALCFAIECLILRLMYGLFHDCLLLQVEFYGPDRAKFLGACHVQP